MGQMQYYKEIIIFIVSAIAATFYALFGTNFSYKSIFILNFIINVFYQVSMEGTDFSITREFNIYFFVIFKAIAKYLEIFSFDIH
jgi:hypothetical protein